MVTDNGREDLSRARWKGGIPERPAVLLAHDPSHLQARLERPDIDLQLSGHTHGGQIWPFAWYLVKLAVPYVAGLYTRGSERSLYVSRGTGFWGPAMRLARAGRDHRDHGFRTHAEGDLDDRVGMNST